MIPGITASGDPAQSPITIVNYSGRTAGIGSNVNYPSGIQAGDLILFIQTSAFAVGATPPATPTGFASVLTNGATGSQSIGARISHRVASGTESGLIPYTQYNAYDTMICVVYRGTHLVTPIDASNSVSGSGTTLSVGDVTPTHGGTTVAFGCILKNAPDGNGFQSYPTPAYSVDGVSYTASAANNYNLLWHFRDTSPSRPAGGTTYGSFNITSTNPGAWIGAQLFLRAQGT